MIGNFSPSEKSMSSPATATASTTTSTTSVEESETRDSSCYFPVCRRDANCSCEICLASINATLDLMPLSIQKSSLTRLSHASRSKSKVETTPISFDPTVMTTPSSISRSVSNVSPPPPPLTPTKKHEKKLEVSECEIPCRSTENKRIPGIHVFFKGVLVLGLALCLELGFCWLVNGILKPEFTRDIVRNAGKRSWAASDLGSKLRFMEDELQSVVSNRKVFSCRDSDSNWKISQDGLMLNSKCVLYKSTMEEVSIWGWPLQTARLLQTGFSSSSITVLSGQVTEWSDGKFGYSIRKANASWVQTKWSISVLQLDPNTWVLEYSRSLTLESSSLLSLTMDLLRHLMFRALRNIKREFFWLVSASEYISSKSATKVDNDMTPT